MIDSSLIPELCRLKWPTDGSDPMTWSQLEEFVGEPRNAFRTQMRWYRRRHPEEWEETEPEVEVEGVGPGDRMPDEDEVYRRAVEEWNKVARLERARNNQSLVFDRGPIALVATADWHMGHSGVDYPRLDADLKLIADTPGMYAIGVGDLLDQMIVGRLVLTRFGVRTSIPDEWALLRRMLRVIAPKLVGVVLGNHDNWLEQLAGISYFERELERLDARMIFDTDDARFVAKVCDWEVPVRVRHKWRGASIYNPTHGIERAVKWDHNFVIGMGAHLHQGGVVRTFCVDGRTGLAMLAGTYKRVDPYARRMGFPTNNTSTSVAVVIDDRTRSLTGFDNLHACAEYLEAVY